MRVTTTQLNYKQETPHTTVYEGIGSVKFVSEKEGPILLPLGAESVLLLSPDTFDSVLLESDSDAAEAVTA